MEDRSGGVGCFMHVLTEKFLVDEDGQDTNQG